MTNPVCRTCLMKTNLKSLDKIKSNHSNLTVIEMLLECCSIQAKNDAMMCESCVEKLHVTYEFKKLYKAAEKIFNPEFKPTDQIADFDDHSHDLDNNSPVDEDKPPQRNKKRPANDSKKKDLVKLRKWKKLPVKVPRTAKIRRPKPKDTSSNGDKQYRCKICSRTFDSLILCKHHRNKHKKYYCDQCPKIYNVPSMLNHHVAYVHNNALPTFRCRECPKVYTMRGNLKRHILTSHEKVHKYTCDKCEKSYTTKYTLRVHMNMHNNMEERLTCQTCGKQFSLLRYYKIHVKMHSHPNNKHSCDICNKEFITLMSVRSHIIESHRNETPNDPTSVKCENCHRTFSQEQKTLYESHVKMHEQVGAQFACSTCNIPFVSSEALRAHNNSEHEEKVDLRCAKCYKVFPKRLWSVYNAHVTMHEYVGDEFACAFCERQYLNFKSLSSHIAHGHKNFKTKNERGKYGYLKCTKCFKNFTVTQAPLYDVHMKLHDDVGDKYGCSYCSRAFLTFKSLRIHVANKHNNTSVAVPKMDDDGDSLLCPNCGQTFTNSLALHEHSLTHSNDRPLSCKYCSRRFNHYSGLYTHIKLHEGVKNYKCHICSKTFVQLPHLKGHLRTHTGDRPYACPFCNKRFAQNGNLTVHKRTHTGETPYLCSECNKGFNNSSARKKHMEAVHKIILPLVPR